MPGRKSRGVGQCGDCGKGIPGDDAGSGGCPVLSRGLSELHLGSPLSPFMEAVPRLLLFASQFKHQVFSLPCPPPILSPMEPRAGAAWRGSWRAVPPAVIHLAQV